MNLIVVKSQYVDYYTYLDPIFTAIPELQKINWLISDLDYNYCEDSRLHDDPILIDGASLNEIVQNNKIQFIWAVLSGFKKPLKKLPFELPYACGNKNFWHGTPKPQAPGAEIEIVCWDSSCTLFINVNKIVADKLKKLYPDIKNLNKENESRG